MYSVLFAVMQSCTKYEATIDSIENSLDLIPKLRLEVTVLVPDQARWLVREAHMSRNVNNGVGNKVSQQCRKRYSRI